MTCVACRTAQDLHTTHRCINDGLEHCECQCPCQCTPDPDPQEWEMETVA